ncbi:MAG: hypothetical protein MUF78_04960 [Candidatus Edwardsbacteria bacterium]|jgi:hypothetical protein|nr:hypothetical protein [Candidatus Edwardsbacteria bacterium]
MAYALDISVGGLVRVRHQGDVDRETLGRACAESADLVTAGKATAVLMSFRRATVGIDLTGIYELSERNCDRMPPGTRMAVLCGARCDGQLRRFVEDVHANRGGLLRTFDRPGEAAKWLQEGRNARRPGGATE